MRISALIFVRVAQPQTFGKKQQQMIGKQSTSPYWRDPWDRLTADIRQETHTKVMRKAGVPHRATSANCQ